jgi:nitroimidazol reductase NimA-like FMN-containing flavoprotein (pyridoxamine 5'-phosphate oxidase superfamily)
MARIPAALSLTVEELDELMTSSWNMRIATVGPAQRINLTPLWFAWTAGRVYFYCRGQKIANLRRNPVCTVLVDCNERFPELMGAMFQGRARVLENVEQEEADPHLEEIR